MVDWVLVRYKNIRDDFADGGSGYKEELEEDS